MSPNDANALPDPLTPADCDLRDFAFMPLDVRRLLDSEWWITALEEMPSACGPAVNLWCASWHQQPAGSLPDNDLVLRRLAGVSADVWQTVRARVLAPFVKCSDGRLYHPVVASKAIEAWEHKLAQRERGRRGNEARWGTRPRGDGGATPTDGAGVSRKDRGAVAEGSQKDRPAMADGSPPDPAAIRDASQPDRKGQGQGKREETPLSGGAGGEASRRGARLPEPWPLTPEVRQAAERTRRNANLPPVNVEFEHAKFCDYWRAKPGKGGTSLDWLSTWRNWCRRAEAAPQTNIRMLPAHLINKNLIAG